MIYSENLNTIDRVEHQITTFGSLYISRIRLFGEINFNQNKFNGTYEDIAIFNNYADISISMIHEKTETTESIETVVFDLSNNNFALIFYSNSDIKWVSELANFIIKNLYLCPSMRFSLLS